MRWHRSKTGDGNDYFIIGFNTIWDDIDLKLLDDYKIDDVSFNTIWDDIDLKPICKRKSKFNSFNTIWDDIDLKPSLFFIATS